MTSGMEDVIAGESAITYIDGRQGELRYRGYAVGDLADQCAFEEVAYLLWHGELPSGAEADELRRDLRRERNEQAPKVLRLVEELPVTGHPLDVVRYAVARDALDNPLAWDNSPAANLAKARAFTAWFPVVVAAYGRRRRGLSPVLPPPDADTAGAFLAMWHAGEPEAVAVRTLDTSLILHADHEFNASTFAARVTIATQSNLHAAIASALGTLTGPRHGGASERVIQMLEEIGTASRVETYVRDELEAHRRIMGFGHRVYRTVDPRSRNLRAMAAQLLAGTPREEWIAILSELSRVMERERALYPNVDLYAAVVNHALGIDPAFYTSVFALARIVGWTAHAMEQLDGRMIRPVARYLGPEPRSLAVPVG